MKVTALRLCTNGANIIELAKRQCAIVQAVSREGLYFSTPVAAPAILFGVRDVKSSGDLTMKGSIIDITNVMMLNEMSAVEPTRPTLPVRSADALTSAGAS